jgi:hypothetical protein
MHNDKQQKVTCKVETCQHHTNGNGCELNSIKIKPRTNNHSGNKEDESMCSNYEGQMS